MANAGAHAGVEFHAAGSAQWARRICGKERGGFEPRGGPHGRCDCVCARASGKHDAWPPGAGGGKRGKRSRRLARGMGPDRRTYGRRCWRCWGRWINCRVVPEANGRRTRGGGWGRRRHRTSSRGSTSAMPTAARAGRGREVRAGAMPGHPGTRGAEPRRRLMW